MALRFDAGAHPGSEDACRSARLTAPTGLARRTSETPVANGTVPWNEICHCGDREYILQMLLKAALEIA